jgi:decaprenylphospho-beta-D-erythro-pentofuranosid-2-ulose 2-reductase
VLTFLEESSNIMKKIFIVGATSAIATACARLWTSEDAIFFLAGRDNVKLQSIADDLKARGASEAYTDLIDLCDIESHESMLEKCFTALEQVDIALIAHGTLPDQADCEQDTHIALQEFSSNGLSTIALLTPLANRMEKQGHGTIAVISSVAGDRGRQSNYLYGAAKASVTTFCEGLRARMFKAGVQVLTIKPGFVDTPMTRGLPLPGPLVSSPDKIAKCIHRGIKRGSNTIYTPRYWSLIMLIIRSIPTVIFKRLSL